MGATDDLASCHVRTLTRVEEEVLAATPCTDRFIKTVLIVPWDDQFREIPKQGQCDS